MGRAEEIAALNAKKKVEIADKLYSTAKTDEDLLEAKREYSNALEIYRKINFKSGYNYCSKKINEINEKLGTSVIIEKYDHKINIESYKSDITFDDLIGVDDIIEDIKGKIEFLWGENNPFKEFSNRSFLFYGPPGTGKTMLAEAISNEYDVPFYPVNMGDILSKYFGESEKILRAIFRIARKEGKAIIFFDEIEAITKRRDDPNSHEAIGRITNIFLSELDGMKSRNDEFIVIGATNYIDKIDDALLRGGRFGKIYYFRLPDKGARKKYFDRIIEKYSDYISDDIDTEKLAEMTKGATISDIKKIILTDVFTEAYLDNPEDPVVNMGRFIKAIEKYQASREYEKELTNDLDIKKSYI